MDTRPSTLFVELFSEEIPARFQAPAAEQLVRLLTQALAPLTPGAARSWSGPRRIAAALPIAAAVAASTSTERGPRETAPDAALAGFLRKHGAERSDLRTEGGFFVLDRQAPSVSAASLVASIMPPLLRQFAWPKAMRWGDGSALTWVRPLRRIVCLLDGDIVPFDLVDSNDDGHGLRSGDLTEGHRNRSDAPIAVRGPDQWEQALEAAGVIACAAERARRIEAGLEQAARDAGLELVRDPGLIQEVAGLVEWPVALLGAIDAGFMDLPPEVMQVSMRVNQRTFALRHPDGSGAARFGFVANALPDDGGALTIAGNERVLRARFADARHFWDLDRTMRLADRIQALERVVFHAKLGSQAARALRLEALSGRIAERIDADPALARRAGLLAKADLTTGMVGEFPELQGVMGGYYARHDGEDAQVADAVASHYQPRGPTDLVPTAPVSVAVALADKLDTLVGFFAIGERPGGSGDPYALRRAALGVLRIVRENRLRLDLHPLLAEAARLYPRELAEAPALSELPAFLAERLRVQLRSEGARHDVLAAVAAASATTGDFGLLLARTEAVAALLDCDDGRDLLAASRRAANILRIEDRKDGPHAAPVDRSPEILREPAEQALAACLDCAAVAIDAALATERFDAAMAAMATLRQPLDRFFTELMVNDPEPQVRRNRLCLLAMVRATLARVADFALIEG